MMFRRAEREKQAREAILAKLIEDYQRRHPHWRNEPALNKTVLQIGFCCWQNLVLIGVTVLVWELCLVIFRPIPIVVLTTLLLGGIIEVVFLYLGCRDDKKLTQALVQRLTPQIAFNLDTIQDKYLKVKLLKALEYWWFINHILSQQPDGLLRDHLLLTTQEATRWLQVVYCLAERVDRFRCNRIILRDWQTLPAIIKNYEHKLSQDPSPDIHYQLERTLFDKRVQWQNLQKLHNCMAKASYQLDSTIASLGTIYSQLLLLTNNGVERSRIRRLQAGISEQVQRLEDLTAAMDEVYQS